MAEIFEWELSTLGGSELSETVAAQLFRLMAYKDEYEVARLHLLGWANRRTISGKVRWHLHPPLLRMLGLRRKVPLGRWILPLFRLLVALRRLRASRLDIFGWPKLRRLERQIITQYRNALTTALAHPTVQENVELLRELAESPDQIRGYEDIKLDAIHRWREEVRQLLDQLTPTTVAAA